MLLMLLSQPGAADAASVREAFNGRRLGTMRCRLKAWLDPLANHIAERPGAAEEDCFRHLKARAQEAKLEAEGAQAHVCLRACVQAKSDQGTGGIGCTILVFVLSLVSLGSLA